MCGALAVSCMRYGVSDTNHLKTIPMLRYTTVLLSALKLIMHTCRWSKWLTRVIVFLHLLGYPKSSIRSWFNAGKFGDVHAGTIYRRMILTVVLCHSLQAARELSSSNIPSVSGAAVSNGLWTVRVGGGGLEEQWPPGEDDWSSLGNSQGPLPWTTKIIPSKQAIVFHLTLLFISLFIATKNIVPLY